MSCGVGNVNNEEMRQNDIGVYVMLQQIKEDPSKLDYFVRVYEIKLTAQGISPDALKLHIDE